MSEQHDNELIYPPEELVGKKLRHWYVRYCKTLPINWHIRVGVSKDYLRVVKKPSVRDYTIIIKAIDGGWYSTINHWVGSTKPIAGQALLEALEWMREDISTRCACALVKEDFLQITG